MSEGSRKGTNSPGSPSRPTRSDDDALGCILQLAAQTYAFDNIPRVSTALAPVHCEGAGSC